MNTDSRVQNTFNLKILLVLSFGHFATDVCQSALPAILPFLKAKLLLTYTMTTAILLASNLTSSVIQPLFGYMSDQKEKGVFAPSRMFVCRFGAGVPVNAQPLCVGSAAGNGERAWNRVLPSGGVQNGPFFYGRQDGNGIGRIHSRRECGIGGRPYSGASHSHILRSRLPAVDNGVFSHIPVVVAMDKALDGSGQARVCLEGWHHRSRQPQGGVPSRLG